MYNVHSKLLMMEAKFSPVEIVHKIVSDQLDGAILACDFLWQKWGLLKKEMYALFCRYWSK